MGGWSPVPADRDLVLTDTAWPDPVVPLHIAQNQFVIAADDLRGQREILAGSDPITDDLVGVEHVAYLLFQVATRGRETEGTVQHPGYLVLGERVALDGGGRMRALAQVRPVPPVGHCRNEGRPRETSASGLRPAERHPLLRAEPRNVEAERQPRMCLRIPVVDFRDPPHIVRGNRAVRLIIHRVLSPIMSLGNGAVVGH